MYLRRLEIQHVRLINALTLEFGAPGWTVVLGDNGSGKSTILQAVALAASGPALASHLIEDAATLRPADLPEAEPVIRCQFQGPAHPDTRVLLSVKKGRHDFTRTKGGSRVDDIRAKRDRGFFVVGYGPGRFLPRPGEVALPENPVRDRVEGLFSRHHKVLGTDFYGALRQRTPEEALSFTRALKTALLAEDGMGEKLFPMLLDVDTRGKSGVKHLERLLESRRFIVSAGRRHLKLPATALSDGYQSMLAWIADLLGHAFLEFGPQVEAGTLRGIALIDEIDLHLHPTWQRKLVPLLKRVFPQMQFIVTTHSPLVVAALEPHEIVRLQLREGEVVREAHRAAPGLMTGTQLLTHYFDVSRAGRADLLEKEREYLELQAMGRRTKRQEDQRKKLEEELHPYWTVSAGRNGA
ncbi:MAG: AAA family ATPase [Deltaproteobacteria bacterium]|nr:AAA family ATPase [Deltaproteobacteria bacterium]